MKLKKDVNGIIVKGEDYEITIAEDGNFKEIWFIGKARVWQEKKERKQ